MRRPLIQRNVYLLYTVYTHIYIIIICMIYNIYMNIRFLSFSEAQEICSEAKADLLQVIEAEPQNKEVRAELKAVQDAKDGSYKGLKALRLQYVLGIQERNGSSLSRAHYLGLALRSRTP